ncbi:hypothetical protein LCGC14_1785050 [marine sediment metagenome]|uniref:DUF6677 domain-containing protein n=1 Tax=marine sediment metagenome TaxID=412755 RepID=A0A0F9GUD6_9ZZZZ
MAKPHKPNVLMPVLAGLLAWAIPGAGHVYLGRTVRGIVLCVCINGMFWTGVAFGGVFTVEPITKRWWFAAQMCTGASGLAGWYRQELVRGRITAGLDIDPKPPRRHAAQWHQSYSEALIKKEIALSYPTSNVARAYSGVAGMLNLMAIFDAVMLGALGRFGEPPPDKKKRPQQERQE